MHMHDTAELLGIFITTTYDLMRVTLYPLPHPEKRWFLWNTKGQRAIQHCFGERREITTCIPLKCLSWIEGNFFLESGWHMYLFSPAILIGVHNTSNKIWEKRAISCNSWASRSTVSHHNQRTHPWMLPHTVARQWVPSNFNRQKNRVGDMLAFDSILATWTSLQDLPSHICLFSGCWPSGMCLKFNLWKWTFSCASAC